MFTIFSSAPIRPRHWSARLEAKLIKAKSRRLVFDRNQRWRGPKDYSFLEATGPIDELVITDYEVGVDLTVIGGLSVESISIQAGVNARWPDAFPQGVRRLEYESSRSSPGVDALPELEVLRVWGNPKWSVIPRFASSVIREIDLDSRHLGSFSGQDLPSLISLKLSGLRDFNFSGLSAFKNLEVIEIVDSKGNLDTSHLESLRSLRRLVIDGPEMKVENIRSLSGLSNLEFLFLGNSLIEGGEVSAIRECAGLKELAFRDRKAYDATLEEILKHLGARRIGLKYP